MPAPRSGDLCPQRRLSKSLVVPLVSGLRPRIVPSRRGADNNEGRVIQEPIKLQERVQSDEVALAEPVQSVSVHPDPNGHLVFDEEHHPRQWVPAVLLAIVALAFLIRLTNAQHLSSHVDEAASIMAAREVAARGVPIFPSGTLYLQGATLSYVLAPFVWAGYGDIEHLSTLRFPSVIAGTLAVVAMFLLGRFVTGSALGGLLGALLLALDPTSARWSAYVRMYAPLQFLSLLLLWLYLRALFEPRRRLLQAMVAVFWVAVFTHIAVLLFWPAMALGAVIVHGWGLRDRRRDLSVALGTCLGAPFVLLLLNQLVEPPDKAVSDTLPGVSFVGDYFVAFDQILHPNIQSWVMLFRRTALAGVMPTVIVAVSALLMGRYLLGHANLRGESARRLVTGLVLLLYWLPVGLVAGFTSGSEERYLLHVHPLGFLLIVILFAELLGWRLMPDIPVISARAGTAAQAGVAAPGALPSWLPAPAATERLQGRLAAIRLTRPVTLALAAGVIALGAALRVFHLFHLSLWLDEGFTVLYSRLPWPSVLGLHGFYSPHPPLYFSLVKAVAAVTSDAVAGRLISVTAAIATLPVFYALATRLLDRRGALVATGVLALSPLHLYYAQEARMYALLVLLVAVTYLALVSYWQQPAWRWAAVYGIAGALAMYVDYSAVYALAPQAVPLAILAHRQGKAARPLGIAIAAAGLAYVPWLPQVLATVGSANEETRRETYLGAQPGRVATALLSITGIAGDGSYFRGTGMAPWNRAPQLRVILLAAVVAVLVAGCVTMWQQWRRGLLIAGCLLAGTVLVSVWISLISPGFAERTVLAATLGWALVAGAAVSAGLRREWLMAAGGSLAIVLLASVTTTGAIYTGAHKQAWRTAAADVATIAPLGMPLVTYSYGAVANTLIDVYQPGLLTHMQVLTIRDGTMEDRLSNGILPAVGLTRQDLAAGKLAEALPSDDPAYDVVWYLYPPRTGEREVHAAFQAAGYTRIFRKLYDDPRYRIWLDLYMRPGARLGSDVPINGRFLDDAKGWARPDKGVSLVPDDGGNRLTVSNTARLGTTVMRDLPALGEGIYLLTGETQTSLPANMVQLTVSCLDRGGEVIAATTSEAPATPPPPDTWLARPTAVWCPRETVTVRVSLTNLGNGDVSFRNVSLSFLAIPRRES
ncbi:MAG: hypothetical protein KatS3mg059_1624 [Thermomicrobiales bacterium]|nr:MAG: hypothetical protein KatS3mg059_1624 [Thermomicrobiales bacterium]